MQLVYIISVVSNDKHFHVQCPYILYTIGREEQLTEAALFWNDRKISSLPNYLKRRLNIKVLYDIVCIRVQVVVIIMHVQSYMHV